MDERELVERARSGDRAAMSRLYHAHADRVHTVVRRLAGNEADADDIAQEAWIRAFRKLDVFRGESSFGTWMYRLATNTALNHLRGESRRSEVTEKAGDRQARRHASKSSLDDVVIDQRALSEAIDRLAPGYRKVLVLHDVEGLTHEEIAGRLGIATGTSKSQLHKARARMREMIAPPARREEAQSDG